jgi:hypothetical protein
MSWRDYNDVIAALREEYDLDLDEARARYQELTDDLGHAPEIGDIDQLDLFNDFDDWASHFEDGYFDNDYDIDEYAGGIEGYGRKE